jgi:hypothetical protein
MAEFLRGQSMPPASFISRICNRTGPGRSVAVTMRVLLLLNIHQAVRLRLVIYVGEKVPDRMTCDAT